MNKNLKFFNQNGNQYNWDFNEEKQCWEGEIFLPKVSTHLFESESIYILESLQPNYDLLSLDNFNVQFQEFSVKSKIIQPVEDNNFGNIIALSQNINNELSNFIITNQGRDLIINKFDIKLNKIVQFQTILADEFDTDLNYKLGVSFDITNNSDVLVVSDSYNNILIFKYLNDKFVLIQKLNESYFNLSNSGLGEKIKIKDNTVFISAPFHNSNQGKLVYYDITNFRYNNYIEKEAESLFFEEFISKFDNKYNREYSAVKDGDEVFIYKNEELLQILNPFFFVINTTSLEIGEDFDFNRSGDLFVINDSFKNVYILQFNDDTLQYEILKTLKDSDFGITSSDFGKNLKIEGNNLFIQAGFSTVIYNLLDDSFIIINSNLLSGQNVIDNLYSYNKTVLIPNLNLLDIYKFDVADNTYKLYSTIDLLTNNVKSIDLSDNDEVLIVLDDNQNISYYYDNGTGFVLIEQNTYLDNILYLEERRNRIIDNTPIEDLLETEQYFFELDRIKIYDNYLYVSILFKNLNGDIRKEDSLLFSYNIAKLIDTSFKEVVSPYNLPIYFTNGFDVFNDKLVISSYVDRTNFLDKIPYVFLYKYNNDTLEYELTQELESNLSIGYNIASVNDIKLSEDRIVFATYYGGDDTLPNNIQFSEITVFRYNRLNELYENVQNLDNLLNTTISVLRDKRTLDVLSFDINGNGQKLIIGINEDFNVNNPYNPQLNRVLFYSNTAFSKDYIKSFDINDFDTLFEKDNFSNFRVSFLSNFKDLLINAKNQNGESYIYRLIKNDEIIDIEDNFLKPNYKQFKFEWADSYTTQIFMFDYQRSNVDDKSLHEFDSNLNLVKYPHKVPTYLDVRESTINGIQAVNQITDNDEGVDRYEILTKSDGTLIETVNAFDFHIAINSINEDRYENYLFMSDLDGNVLLRLRIYGEVEGEDERYSTFIDNLGISVLELNNECSIKAFAGTDINEELVDWIFMNAKHKELLLQHHEIFPFIGSYKGLINALKFYGYDNIFIKEYWVNVAGPQDPYFGKQKSYDIDPEKRNFNDEYTIFTESNKWQKTNRLSLTYRLNKTTDAEDFFELPIVEEDSQFSPQEVLLKLNCLKSVLQRKFMPHVAKITDIIGEGDFYGKQGVDVWNNQQLIDVINVGILPDFDILGIDVEVGPDGNQCHYIQDLRKFETDPFKIEYYEKENILREPLKAIPIFKDELTSEQIYNSYARRFFDDDELEDFNLEDPNETFILNQENGLLPDTFLSPYKNIRNIESSGTELFVFINYIDEVENVIDVPLLKLYGYQNELILEGLTEQLFKISDDLNISTRSSVIPDFNIQPIIDNEILIYSTTKYSLIRGDINGVPNIFIRYNNGTQNDVIFYIDENGNLLTLGEVNKNYDLEEFVTTEHLFSRDFFSIGKYKFIEYNDLLVISYRERELAVIDGLGNFYAKFDIIESKSIGPKHTNFEEINKIDIWRRASSPLSGVIYEFDDEIKAGGPSSTIGQFIKPDLRGDTILTINSSLYQGAGRSRINNEIKVYRRTLNTSLGIIEWTNTQTIKSPNTDPQTFVNVPSQLTTYNFNFGISFASNSGITTLLVSEECVNDNNLNRLHIYEFLDNKFEYVKSYYSHELGFDSSKDFAKKLDSNVLLDRILVQGNHNGQNAILEIPFYKRIFGTQDFDQNETDYIFPRILNEFYTDKKFIRAFQSDRDNENLIIFVSDFISSDSSLVEIHSYKPVYSPTTLEPLDTKVWYKADLSLPDPDIRITPNRELRIDPLKSGLSYTEGRIYLYSEGNYLFYYIKNNRVDGIEILPSIYYNESDPNNIISYRERFDDNDYLAYKNILKARFEEDKGFIMNTFLYRGDKKVDIRYYTHEEGEAAEEFGNWIRYGYLGFLTEEDKITIIHEDQRFNLSIYNKLKKIFGNFFNVQDFFKDNYIAYYSNFSYKTNIFKNSNREIEALEKLISGVNIIKQSRLDVQYEELQDLTLSPAGAPVSFRDKTFEKFGLTRELYDSFTPEEIAEIPVLAPLNYVFNYFEIRYTLTSLTDPDIKYSSEFVKYKDLNEFKLILPITGEYEMIFEIKDLFNISSFAINKRICVKNRAPIINGIYQNAATKDLTWDDIDRIYNNPLLRRVNFAWDYAQLQPNSEWDEAFGITLAGVLERANYPRKEGNPDYSVSIPYVNDRNELIYTTGPYYWDNLEAWTWDDVEHLDWDGTSVRPDEDGYIRFKIDTSFDKVNRIEFTNNLGTIFNVNCFSTYYDLANKLLNVRNKQSFVGRWQWSTINDALVEGTYSFATGYNTIILDKNELNPMQLFRYQNLKEKDTVKAGLDIFRVDKVSEDLNKIYIRIFSDEADVSVSEGEGIDFMVVTGIVGSLEFLTEQFGITDIKIFGDGVILKEFRKHVSRNPKWTNINYIGSHDIIKPLTHVTFTYDGSNVFGINHDKSKWTLKNLSDPLVDDIYFFGRYFPYLFKVLGNYSVSVELTDINGNVTSNEYNLISVKRVINN